MKASWTALTSRVPRFSVRGLFLLIFLVAVFFGSYRAWTAGGFFGLDRQPGSGLMPFSFALYAVLAASLVIGLVQQARDIRLAMLQAGEPARNFQAGASWNIVWRCLLASLIGFLFSIRYLRRPEWLGLDFLSEASNYQQDEGFVNLDQPLSDSLLLLSYVITTIPVFPRRSGEKVPARRLLAVSASGLGLLIAAVWLGFILAQAALLPALTHSATRNLEMSQPVFVLGHRLHADRFPDPCISLFYRMAISSVAGCVGVAAIRWLSKVWDAGLRWRIAPFAVVLAATAVQIYFVTWAVTAGMPQASEYLWDSRPPVLLMSNFLGAALLLVGTIALAQRWRNTDNSANQAVALAWRKPQHFYPHEWAIVPLAIFWIGSYVYSTLRQLAEGNAFPPFRELVETFAYFLVDPGTLVYLSVILTAAVRLYRWLRGDDLLRGGEIRAGSNAPVLTTAPCLFLTGILMIPALFLAAFAGWMVSGYVPVR